MTRIFGSKHERDMRRLRPLIEHINSFESQLEALTDSQLQAKTPHFKERLAQGQTLDDILPEAFAVCREAGRRVLGMRHYDVQLIGGITLHRGAISEMKTGEGKTLVATLPVYLNALEGRGVHVVTVNDYLAKRDEEWMGRLYRFMGLTTGTIVHERTDQERKLAYAADITYGTNNEFGFDYLRDNMKFSLDDYVQRELNYAIVDECDSILIDESRTPLIISGPKEDSTDKYFEINKVIPSLESNVHFTIEEKSKSASLTEEGNSRVEQLLNIENLYDPRHIDLLHHIYQALKAHHLYKRDVDYMVKDGEVVIVDEFTGRLMPGRRWSDGLHQAIEAKEGVRVKNENQTLATITFQNYFRMYRKLAGMTGTAETEAIEFKKIYNLDVQVIPTNRPIRRKDWDDVVYKTEKAKFKAMVTDIQARATKGQPILVGTVSIEKSERLSRALKAEGVTHNVLNAKHHEREAEIIAQAGRKGRVTIATNMAGRGTDIVLGGNPEYLAKAEANENTTPEQLDVMIKRHKELCDREKEEVIAAGGLYIMGTERHESRRIDNQLRGRAGRQGDPGESMFYLSLEDDLMRIFNGERIQRIMNTLRVPEDEPITAPMVSRAIEGAQRKVEGHHFDVRKHLLEYDNVMNQQRRAIYGLRREILKGDEIERQLLDMLGESISDLMDFYAPENVPVAKWDLEGLAKAIQHQFGLILYPDHLREMSAEAIVQHVRDGVKALFDKQKATLGDIFPQLGRMLMLQTIDYHWKEHLERIDRLKEGINLRAYAQKDPLIEYKKEASKRFDELFVWIRRDTTEKLLKIQVVSRESAQQVIQDRPSFDDSSMLYRGAEQPSGSVLQELGGASASSPAQARYAGAMSLRSADDEGPKLNREQRRRLEKKNKKRR